MPAAAAAAVALGAALQVNDGMLDPAAIGLVTAAFALLLAALLAPAAGGRQLPARMVPVLCGLGLAVQIGELSASAPGVATRFDSTSHALFAAGVGALGLIAAALVCAPSRRRRWPLVALLTGIHFALGVLVIRHSQSTFIDVDVFQRESVAALLKGINPYAITFPNIYNNQSFYGPDAANGRLQFGFPYFPLTLLLAVPGELLAGDHRYAALAAMEMAAVLMIGTRRGGFGPFAAALYLTTPRIFFVLEQSWTEPYIVLALAAVVFAACRYQTLVPWLFGALIALKQYLVLALPAAVLLLRRDDRRSLADLFGKATLLGAIVTLPFVLWNPAAFINSVVTLQFRQPFRGESLSYLAWWVLKGHPQPSAATAFVVAGLVVAIAVWALPRTPAAFAGALAVTFLAFFSFNKQAFCNYYFFVVGALCVTLAASERTADAEPARAAGRAGPPLKPQSLAEWVALGALAAACAIPLLFPGDVPFINDEPQLIAAALHANAAHQLADHGLLGTFGVVYGPFPTWIYQALIAITTNLVAISFLHTLLIVAATGAALWWLSRSLGLWAWFAPIPLLSPYFWFYARALWDNPLLIPLGSLAIAAYAAHLTSQSKVGLPLAIAAMLSMPLVHLMSVAFVLPLALHMVVTRWRSLWVQRGIVTTVVAAIVIAAWPYCGYLVTARTPPAPGGVGPDGFLFPLLGGRVLSARDLAYFYGPGPVAGTAFRLATAFSSLAYVLVWAGLVLSIFGVIAAARSRRWTARAQLSLIAVAVVLTQILLDGFTGKFEHPQYYNATWIVFALLAWLAVDRVAAWKSPWGLSAAAGTAVLGGALLVAIITLGVRLHVNRGTRTIYGPTLANQLQVARELSNYAPGSQLSTSVFQYAIYPHVLETLREVTTRRYQSGPYAELEIRYASPDVASGAIELVRRRQ